MRTQSPANKKFVLKIRQVFVNNGLKF